MMRTIRWRAAARSGVAALSAAMPLCAAVALATLAGCGPAISSRGVSSGGATVDERYLSGAATEGDDKLSSLLGDLNHRVASRPDDAVAWRDLGITQTRLGIYKDARNALDRAAPALPSDPYLAGYRALTLEMLGESESAALEYGRAAGLLPMLGTRLKARAALVRARARLRAADPERDTAAGPATIALLAPVDLAAAAGGGVAAATGGDLPAEGARATGGTPVSTEEALAVALGLGVAAAPGVTVLSPAESDAFLAADKHVARDFDAEQARAAAAKGLARRGVERALATSFLLLEDGTLHVRVALLPLSSTGAGEPTAPALEPGAADQELLPLASALPELWRAAAVDPPAGDPASWMPTSLAGARAYAAGMRAFTAGEYGPAQAALAKAATACPTVAAVARWRDAAAAAAPYASDPLVTGAGEPRAVIDALRSHAQQEKRKLDEQLGPSDTPF